MSKRLRTIYYILLDFLTAGLAWTVFNFYRKTQIDTIKSQQLSINVFDNQFFISVLVLPLIWVLVYYLMGSYNNVLRRSRINEFVQLLAISIIGVTVLFFVILLDDYVASYKLYYKLYFVLFISHFGFTSFFRLILSSNTNKKIHLRKFGFNTIIIGSNERALKMFREVQALKYGIGNQFIGFVHIEGKNGYSEQLKKELPHLGEYHDIRTIIEINNVEEVIIALESWEHEYIKNIVNDLSDMGIVIKIIPDIYDILSGHVKMNSILGTPLIEIKNQIIPEWQISVKRFIDVSISIIVLICFSWMYVIIALFVKLGSKGRIFFKQERIGIHGKPFHIFKFRTMFSDAEKNGPALSSDNDPRITPIGKFLRRVRLDEMPQFFNVLKGDMSIVGPRPDRKSVV